MGQNSDIDWSGLLKWSLKYTDGTKPSENTPLSEENIKFLEEAFKQATQQLNDPNQAVRVATEKLTSSHSTDDQKFMALYVIKKYVDDFPEISRDLDSLGTLKPLLQIMDANKPRLANVVYKILAFALPNNHTLQLAAWNLGALDLLMNDEKDLTDNIFRFGALSGLVRHARCIEQNFMSRGGHTILAAAISSSHRKVRIKGANLLRHMTSERLLVLEDVLSSGIPDALSRMVKDILNGPDSIQYAETSASAVQALVELVLKSCDTQSMSSDEKHRIKQHFTSLCDNVQESIKALESDPQLYQQEKNQFDISFKHLLHLMSIPSS